MQSLTGRFISERGLVFLAVVFLVAASARAQEDKELTAAYQGCLARFPSGSQEKLRVAQRAWIVFSNKNEAAAAAAGARLGWQQDELDRYALAEVAARARILREYSTLPNADAAALNREHERAEQDLTAVYKQCIAGSNPEEERTLREAQRAWIDYREKDARARPGEPTGRAPIWAKVVIDRRRTQEMHDFYLRGVPPTAPALPNPPPATAERGSVSDPVPATPAAPRTDPERRAKLAAEFRSAATALLARAEASGVLEPVASLGEVRRLPVDLVRDIDALQPQAGAVSKQFPSANRPDDVREDLYVAECLTLLRIFVEKLDADVPAAAHGFANAESMDPAANDATRRKLRGQLEALKTLCTQAVNDASVHLEKAEDLADAGKTAAALKEYQEAYRLCPDPVTAKTIDRMREDNLGSGSGPSATKTAEPR